MTAAPVPGARADLECAVRLVGLTIAVAGRTLLEKVDAEFPRGGTTLIVGASGAGKTVLLKVLAGLEDRTAVHTWGRVEFLERAPRRRRRVGIVFQNFALFDELGAAANIAFARDHGPGRAGPSPEEWLREFRVPGGHPVRYLSGGQQQRLAIARTLAYDPPIIIYDEPTSGLDPVNAERVADWIRTTTERHGKTSVVVSHDWAKLAPIAARVFLLDPETRTLSDVTGVDTAELEARLRRADRSHETPAKRPSTLGRMSRALVRPADGTGRAVEACLHTVARLFPAWRSPRWGLRYLLHYLLLIASPSAWVYFAFAGVITGFVSTYFTFELLPHRNITEPLIADELLQGLGTVLYRSVVPVLATILMAARSGAAIASDVGQRSYGHQLDSMRSFGVRPASYLLTTILFAFLIASPLLVGAAFLAAKLTSLVVFVHNHPEHGAFFWDRNFHHDLRVGGKVLYFGSIWLLAKVLLCGLGIGSIAFHVGARRKSSGVDVSRGITATIIWATIFVLVVHFAFAFYEFEAGR